LTANPNQVAMFTGNCNIEPSAISQSGGNVGVGTSVPGYTLDVNGTGRIDSFVFNGTGGGYNYMSLPYYFSVAPG